MDYENSNDYDVSVLTGHIFVVGNLSSIHLQQVYEIEAKYKHLKFHFFDTQHTQKNYADIIVATFAGEVLQACGTLKEINFISEDKGFESIKYFLESQGQKNVNILIQKGASAMKLMLLRKLLKAII